MSEVLDRAQRELAEMRRTLNALQSGIPAFLGVLVHSDAPHVIKAAIKDKLAPYGLLTVEEATEAGCEISVLCLPYCEGRTVDKTDQNGYKSLAKAGKDTSAANPVSAAQNEVGACIDNAPLLDT